MEVQTSQRVYLPNREVLARALRERGHLNDYISLDREMLSWFRHSQGMQIPFQSVDEILNICQEFAQDQWDYEHDYWQEIQNNPNARNSNGEPIKRTSEK